MINGLSGLNGHLGERVTALVDGELSHDARDRALAHLAGCPHCRAAVDAERLTKGRVAALDASGVGPGPSPELMARLRDLGHPDEPPGPPQDGPRNGGVAAGTFPSMTSFPIARLRPHAPSTDGHADGTSRRSRQQFGARVAVAGSLK